MTELNEYAKSIGAAEGDAKIIIGGVGKHGYTTECAKRDLDIISGANMLPRTTADGSSRAEEDTIGFSNDKDGCSGPTWNVWNLIPDKVSLKQLGRILRNSWGNDYTYTYYSPHAYTDETIVINNSGDVFTFTSDGLLYIDNALTYLTEKKKAKAKWAVGDVITFTEDKKKKTATIVEIGRKWLWTKADGEKGKYGYTPEWLAQNKGKVVGKAKIAAKAKETTKALPPGFRPGAVVKLTKEDRYAGITKVGRAQVHYTLLDDNYKATNSKWSAGANWAKKNMKLQPNANATNLSYEL